MQARLTSLEESVRLAAATKGTVVLVDAADATSSGAPGDSNAILRQLLAAGYRGKALMPIVDPGRRRGRLSAGVGGTVTTKVGGAFDAKRHRPLEITARVRMLSDGRFRSESFGQEWYCGQDRRAAGGQRHAGGDEPAGASVRSLAVFRPRPGPALLRPGGGQVAALPAAHVRRLVRPPHQRGRTRFDQRQPAARLGHTRCRRPIFPLDEPVPWTPRATVFSRAAR